MVTSISDREPQSIDGVLTVASDAVRLTVTGLDENGQMFREAAPILNLNGRDCSFRSKFQPEVGSWMLIEIDLTKQGSKRSTLQGQVRSVHAEGVATNLFQVRVDLEVAQEVRVVSSSTETVTVEEPAAPPSKKPAATAVPPQPIPVEIQSSTTNRPVVENSPSVAEPVASTPASVSAPNLAPNTAQSSAPNSAPSSAANSALDPEALKAEVAAEIDEQLSAWKAELSKELQESVERKIASELELIVRPAMIKQSTENSADVKEQFAAWKISFPKELEQIAQRTVAANLDQVVRPAIEKQISVSYQSAIQTLNSDLSYQVVGRVAGSEELRASVEKMAKGILEEQIGISKNSAIEAQQNLNLQVAEVTRTFEAYIAETQSRLKSARDGVVEVLDRAQAVQKETAACTQTLQKAVEQLNQTARSTIEKFDGHVTSQLNSWSAQFKKHLDDVMKEKSNQFSKDSQQQLAPLHKNTNEIMEKLAAGLQLARGTIRMQEEQMDKLSRAAATEFEKEIKAVLMRLAGNV